MQGAGDRRALRPGPGRPQSSGGPRADAGRLQAEGRGLQGVFPDLKADLQDIIASGDTVATRWIVTGSLQHEFMEIPASGQTVRVEGMNFYRLKDGRLTDIWTQFDGAAMMRQLGAIPA